MSQAHDTASIARIASVAARNPPGPAPVLGDLLRLVEHDLRGVESLLCAEPLGHSRCASAAASLLDAGGKRLRPALCLLSHRLAGGRPVHAEPVLRLAAGVELLHSASLLHDDVIDEAAVRRGMPAARVQWGNAVSVIGGDLLLVQSLQTIHALSDPYLDELTDRTLRAVVEGEIAQLDARGRLETNEDAFMYIAERKTASLFILAMVGGARVARGDDRLLASLHEFARWMGLAYQLRDDLLDVCGTPEQLGKAAGQDLATGCITLPLADVLSSSASLRAAVAAHLEKSADRSLPASLASELRHAASSPDVLARSHALFADWLARAADALSGLPEGEERQILSIAIDFLAAPAAAAVSARERVLHEAS